MESKWVHLAISTHTLASLIESGAIHAENFTCLNADAKKTVWALFLAAMPAKIKKLQWSENHDV